MCSHTPTCPLLYLFISPFSSKYISSSFQPSLHLICLLPLPPYPPLSLSSTSPSSPLIPRISTQQQPSEEKRRPASAPNRGELSRRTRVVKGTSIAEGNRCLGAKRGEKRSSSSCLFCGKSIQLIRNKCFFFIKKETIYFFHLSAVISDLKRKQVLS